MKSERRKFRIALIFAVVFATLALVSVGCVSATTHYVNPGEFIQAAVNAADSGDTIIVRDGTYTENINVNKGLTIQSENGSENCIVQAKNPYHHVFSIIADYANISGFTIKNATEWKYGHEPHAGIYLRCNYSTIFDNKILNNGHGIFLYNSLNNDIENNNISNNIIYGVYLKDSSLNNKIVNNFISDNYIGIRLYSPFALIYYYKCSNNNIVRNNITSNDRGISIDWHSDDNIIKNNIVLDNGDGIYIESSSNNTVKDNIVSNNYDDGICLDDSSYSTLINNTANLNKNYGIYLDSSYANTLIDNKMSGNKYNFHIREHFGNSIDTSNRVEDKPIYYLRGIENRVYDSSTNAGVFYCINCNNVTVKDLFLTKNVYGVFFSGTRNSTIENITTSNNGNGLYLEFSNNNILTNNTASSNNIGIQLCDSSKNILTYNILKDNEKDGIFLWPGVYPVFSHNRIYLNDFIDNNHNARSLETNIWNSTEKITYTYNGKTYKNYLGNYWSDYEGTDTNNDGIGDAPYPIGSDKDNYPLMVPFENYFAPPPSEQSQLKAPWEGTAKITQGNNAPKYDPWSHYDHGTWDNTYAIDVALPVGSDVLVPADGTVIWYDDDPDGAGGKELAIEHTGPTGKKFTTVYLHLSEIIVKSDAVKQGQVVAKSGDTGDVTGAHLHFHIWSDIGSYDSHTKPIERLLMKQVGVDSDFREYDARNGDLDNNKIAGKFFESNNINQTGKKQVETATGTGTAYFGSDAGTIEDLVSVDESELPPEDKPDVVFLHGFFSFRVDGLTPGDTVTLTITLPSALPVGSEYWKYGPTAANPAGEWYQIPIGDDDGDEIITIDLTDGGIGDDDLTANGVIVDQGGPALPPSASYVVSSDDSGTEQNTFELSEDVYCYARNLPASTSVDIYVANNKDVWEEGDTLTDVSGGNEKVTSEDDGSISTTLIWCSPLTQGSYDIVVDINRNGEWNEGEPIDGKVNVGFEAIPEFTTIAIPVAIVLGLIFLISRIKRKE